MRKILLVYVFIGLCTTYSVAQEDKGTLIENTTKIEAKEEKKEEDKEQVEEGWKRGGMLSINLSQVSLTNWAAGGLSSYAANGLFNFFAAYNKGNSSWDNQLDLGYGVIKQFGQGEVGKNQWLKSDDKLDFNSKFGQKAANNWYYSALLNFKTQFAPGYENPALPDSARVRISDLFSPAYILTAIGMDYKKKDQLSFFIAPLTAKTTIVADQDLADLGAFGVQSAEYDINTGTLIAKGENIRYELGAYMRMTWKKEVMENVTFSTKLELFNNYLVNFGNVDVNWETLTTMKINKWLSANLITQLIYDDDIKIARDTNGDGIMDKSGPAIQFKEVFGAGLTYKY